MQGASPYDHNDRLSHKSKPIWLNFISKIEKAHAIQQRKSPAMVEKP
jgi:hypothetical protein